MFPDASPRKSPAASGSWEQSPSSPGEHNSLPSLETVQTAPSPSYSRSPPYRSSSTGAIPNVSKSGYAADSDAEERLNHESGHSAAKSNRSRRNSSSNIPPATLTPVDGYATDDDANSVQSARSLRRRASLNAQRRGSGFSRNPPQPVRTSPYGPLDDSMHSEDDRHAPRALSNVTGSHHADSTGRLGSARGGYEKSPTERGDTMPRRTSNGYGYDDVTPRRRGSSGYGYEDVTPRRNSNRGAQRRGSGYANQERRGSAGRRMSGGYAYGVEILPQQSRRMSGGGVVDVDPILSPRRGSGHGSMPRPPTPPKAPTRMGHRSSAGGMSRRGSADGVSRRSSTGGMSRMAYASERDDSMAYLDDSFAEFAGEGMNIYGYHNSTPANVRQSTTSITAVRRGSERSHASSQRSRRRSSAHLAAAERMSGHLRPEADEPEDEYSPEQKNGMYGFGSSHHSRRGPADGLDSDSDHSRSSASSGVSSRRSRRRNSCLLKPETDPLAESLLDKTPRLSDRDLLAQSGEVSESDDDLDSFLRVGYHGDSPILSEGRLERPARMVETAKKSQPSIPRPARTARDNVPIKQESGHTEKDTAKSRKPFTTPHAALTPQKLAENAEREAAAHRKRSDEPPKPALGGAWGDLNLSSEDESTTSAEAKDDLGNLYSDSVTVHEIDRYKQRARRRDSIEGSFYSIPETPDRIPKMGQHLPDFKPAAGCTNASDFIVRVFTARLRTGIIVLKHNRSRWSKSTYRSLVLLPDGQTLCWKPLEGEQDKGRRPKLDLTKCKEVRHAWTRDPETRRLTGTGTLRKRCKDGMASKSFSLIFAKRTLDLTAVSNDQCKVLMEGFSALCFRLKLEHQGDDDDSDMDRNDRFDTKSNFTDDDWASTVYGGESTVSMTQTNTTSQAGASAVPVARWGL